MMQSQLFSESEIKVESEVEKESSEFGGKGCLYWPSCIVPQAEYHEDRSIPWADYIKVADTVSKRVKAQDHEDCKHDILIRLVERKPRRQGFMYLVATQTLIDRYRKEQYRQHQSYNIEIELEDGSKVELIELFAANQRQLDDVIADRDLLRSLPIRAVRYATKLLLGVPITKAEYEFMRRFRLGIGQRQLF